MKKIIMFFIVFINVTLYAQHISDISNIQFESRPVEFSRYNGSVNKYQDRLYVESEEKLEEYLILPNGDLQQISYFDKFNFSTTTAFISGDSLFCFAQDEDSFVMYIFDIGVSPMQLIQRIDTNISVGYFLNCNITDNFILLSDAENQKTIKYNRNTLSFDDQINNLHGIYIVTDSLLTVYGCRYENNTTLYTLRFFNFDENCNNIEYASFIYEVELGSPNNGGDLLYLKRDNDMLYLLGWNEVRVLDISDMDSVTTVYQRFTPSSSDRFYYLDAVIQDSRIYSIDNAGRFRVFDINSQNQVYQELGFYGLQYGALCLDYPNLYMNAYTKINRYNIENEIELSGNYGLTSLGSVVKNEYVGLYDFCNKRFQFTSVLNNQSIYVYNDNINEGFYSFDFEIKDNNLYMFYYIGDQQFFEIYEITGQEVSLIATRITDFIYHSFSLVDDNFFFCRINQANGLYYTDLFRLNNNEIEFQYSFQGNYYQVTPYLNDDYLMFNTRNALQMRSRSNPITLIYEMTIPTNSIYFSSFINEDVILTKGTTLQKLYRYTDNSISFLEQLVTQESSGILEFNQILSVKNFYDETASLYSIGSGTFSLVGNISENRDALFFVYPEEHKIASFGTSGVNVYSFDYTIANDETISSKPQSITVYPNPCNTDNVRFKTDQISGVEAVSIYNIKGQLIKKLDNAVRKDDSTEFIWDKKDKDGKTVASGVYFYQTKSQGKRVFGKLMILK
jgi:hypothetical protein